MSVGGVIALTLEVHRKSHLQKKKKLQYFATTYFKVKHVSFDAEAEMLLLVRYMALQNSSGRSERSVSALTDRLYLFYPCQ